MRISEKRLAQSDYESWRNVPVVDEFSRLSARMLELSTSRQLHFPVLLESLGGQETFHSSLIFISVYQGGESFF